mgnify:CR=1 FL=1
MKRRSLPRALVALAAACSLAPAFAAWPDKPINLVVPYAPGGTADALARLVAQHLGPRLKTTVVVLNKAGASGVIGQGEVARGVAHGVEHRDRQARERVVIADRARRARPYRTVALRSSERSRSPRFSSLIGRPRGSRGGCHGEREGQNARGNSRIHEGNR